MKMNVTQVILVMKMRLVTTRLDHLSAFVTMALKEIRHSVKVC